MSPSTGSTPPGSPPPAPLRIAVTGASGFFGGRVMRHLQSLGHTVYGFGGRPRDRIDADLQLAYASWDITVGPLADAPEVDAVVHCAAKVIDWGPRDEFISANVVGTRNVLATWPDARFVHISTASVYDDHTATTFTEDMVVPQLATQSRHAGWLNSYAITKRVAEYEVATRNENHAILRPHVIYGPSDTTILPGLMSRVRRGKLFIPGNGDEVRLSITHVDNLVQGVERALASDATGAFNIADRVTPTAHEALAAMLAILRVDARVVFVPRALAWHAAPLLETVWRLRRAVEAPPFTRYTIAHVAWTHMLDLTRSTELLGYEPVMNFPESFATLSIEPTIAARLARLR